jgi:hypothetical protein
MRSAEIRDSFSACLHVSMSPTGDVETSEQSQSASHQPQGAVRAAEPGERTKPFPATQGPSGALGEAAKRGQARQQSAIFHRLATSSIFGSATAKRKSKANSLRADGRKPFEEQSQFPQGARA